MGVVLYKFLDQNLTIVQVWKEQMQTMSMTLISMSLSRVELVLFEQDLSQGQDSLPVSALPIPVKTLTYC